VDRTVCLVIPARNSAGTIGQCLTAAVVILEKGELARIVVVDDGSTDETAGVVGEYPVTCIRSAPRGRGAARNLGWRACEADVIWFMDADCVAQPDALSKLLPHFDDPQVGGVGGSFTMPDAGPLLACLIHHEIIERHRRMPDRINFVATGNAAYRRSVLEEVGGFDERMLLAQDADLSYRVREAGFALAFEFESRVEHFHDSSIWSYLRRQAGQGYWRLWLHLRHSAPAMGDSYSSLVDNVQPPLAMLLLASLPALFIPHGWPIALVLAVMLAAAQIPMTVRILRSTGRWALLSYAPMGFLRAFARGFGLSWAVVCYVASRVRTSWRRGDRDD
jgi:glycosyltransferase involved in cell wall biosynthesis